MLIGDAARAVIESDALAHLVTIEPDGGPQVSLVWVGLEVKSPPMDDPPSGVVVHIAAERLGGVGPWA